MEIGMNLTPQQFRRFYHRMLEPRPMRFHIADKTDDRWGIVITRTAISGVQVWHSLDNETLTLALTTEATKSLIPVGCIPDGSVAEISPSGWRMFRWKVPHVSGLSEPAEQPSMNEVIQRVKFCFEWFRMYRVDLNPPPPS